MRVHEVAEQLNVSTSTVRKYAREGLLEHDLTLSGQRVFTQESVDKFLGKPLTPVRVFYVRSSKGSKSALLAQVEELTSVYGEPVRVYSDNGSGLNENRKSLQRLLKNASTGEFNEVCITHEDRLTRFGFTYLSQLLSKDKVTVTVLHDKVKYSLEEELLADFMNLLSSFSGRFYRLRSRDTQKQLLDKAREELNE